MQICYSNREISVEIKTTNCMLIIRKSFYSKISELFEAKINFVESPIFYLYFRSYDPLKRFVFPMEGLIVCKTGFHSCRYKKKK